MDVWIKDAEGKPFIGKVWPGLTVFPDFTRTNSFAYWEQNVGQFQQVAAFDGLCKYRRSSITDEGMIILEIQWSLCSRRSSSTTE
jgi:hypothetical protein